MVDHHLAVGAGVTVAAIPVPRREASSFGVIEVDDGWRILDFHEKVADPPGMPGDDSRCLASMGNYVFDTKTLIEIVTPREDQYTDLGGDVIPALTRAGVAHAYDFSTNVVPGRTNVSGATGADVGTIDAYYHANMDLIAPHPCSTSTTAGGRCTRTAPLNRRPRCPGDQAASRPTSTAACCARGRSSPAPTSSGRSSPRACTSTTTPTSPTRSCSPVCGSVPAPGCSGASSTRTWSCRTGDRIGLDRRARPRALHGQRRGHHRHREGPQALTARWRCSGAGELGDDRGERLDVVAADDHVAEAPAPRRRAADRSTIFATRPIRANGVARSSTSSTPTIAGHAVAARAGAIVGDDDHEGADVQLDVVDPRRRPRRGRSPPWSATASARHRRDGVGADRRRPCMLPLMPTMSASPGGDRQHPLGRRRRSGCGGCGRCTGLRQTVVAR